MSSGRTLRGNWMIKNSLNNEDNDAASYHNCAVRSKAASSQSKTKKYFVPHGHFRLRIPPSLMRAENGPEQASESLLSNEETMETALKKVEQESATLKEIKLISQERENSWS